MDFEKYWQQTREKWEGYVASPSAPGKACGFCSFPMALESFACALCPVHRVYGSVCEDVGPVRAYCIAWSNREIDAKDLSRLAEAVVQELEDRKDELITAMRELWEEADG